METHDTQNLLKCMHLSTRPRVHCPKPNMVGTVRPFPPLPLCRRHRMDEDSVLLQEETWRGVEARIGVDQV